MPNREHRTSLLITGDSRGAIRATKLTDEALAKLEKRQRKGKSIAAGYAATWGNLTHQALRYATVAGGVAGTVLFPGSAVIAAAKYEKQLVGVSKTTNIVGKELRDLGAGIDNMSKKMPASTSRLLELAQSAGQLGVQGTRQHLQVHRDDGKA
ncbi:MAG: hypothetical protein U5O39_00415 [Gammaproteobacteria bacterium]|nr:hypothetical protein [Gammaproteobacteria bacterium]